MQRIGVVPRHRLKNIPSNLKAKHEYCFFLHDQCVLMLTEYEQKKAHFVTVKFESDISSREFQRVADAEGPIEALRRTGHPEEAKRVVLNQITMAMVSDCLHHLFEGLRCLEKRKIVVALNILRKPLKDNLTYLSWLLGDEDEFYREFMTGDPERLTQQRLGNTRVNILSKAIANTRLADLLDASVLEALLFDRRTAKGLEGLFQHAVHLITVRHLELRTSAQNFNFIFANPDDDDIYHDIYAVLPHVFLFLSHVCANLFERMTDPGANQAFCVRSVCGYCLVEDRSQIEGILGEILAQSARCGSCGKGLHVTPYNAARIVLTESVRCTYCRRINDLPFSQFF